VIPQVARISAPKRTFRGKGVMVVRRVKARTKKGLRSALRPAGFGIDVRFRGTKLRRPLTVAYRVGKRPPGFKPRYTHITDSGAWELEQGARLRRGKWLVVRTKSFSSIVPSWLKPSAWWDTIGDWARSAGRWASKAIGGRTDPLGNCGPPPPGWFSYSQGTDLVHTCTIDNAGRAEIQIKSNRGVAMVVTVPGNPAYVWVEDRPAWVRNMQARLWSNPDRDVLLGPGQRMTVGYTQPPAGFRGNFSINLDDPRAWLDNLIRGAVDLVGDAPAAALITYTMTRCFSGAELGASTARLSPSVSIDKAGCMFQALLGLANDPERALQIVVGFGGNKGDAADLLRKARSLSLIAKALSVLGPVKDLALQAIDDSMRALFNDGNASIFVRLAPGPNGEDTGGGGSDPGSVPDPVDDPPLQSDTQRLSAGSEHTCALRSDDTVACWGSNVSGKSTPPAGTFKSVSAGGAHTCAIRSDDTIACWGSDSDDISTAPAAGTFKSIDAGSAHTCAIRGDGTIVCWGWNPQGEATPPADTFKAVSAGAGHTCAIRSDDTVACWGGNFDGQATPPAGTFRSVSAGAEHTCAIRSDDTVACWGRNDIGQSTPPTGTFKSVSVSREWHTCAIRSDDTVACWGSDFDGKSTPPTGAFKLVSAGGAHTCGIRTDDSVACWGSDFTEQATPPTDTYTLVSVGSGGHTCAIKSGDDTLACWGHNEDGQSTPPTGTFKSVSAGTEHTCAIKSDDTLNCWGEDNRGQSTPPAGTFKSISAGHVHNCAIRSDDTIVCWGSNVGGESTPSAGTFKAVAAGNGHTCAIRSDDTIACWGSDSSGEATPPAGTYMAISAGGAFGGHTCAIKNDNTVACWGLTSGPIPAGTFKTISAGGEHNCAVASDDTIACWGSDLFGESTPPTGTFKSVSAGSSRTCGFRKDNGLFCWGGSARQPLW